MSGRIFSYRCREGALSTSETAITLDLPVCSDDGSGKRLWNRGRQNLKTVPCDQHIVLYSYATPAGNIDSRLDRDNHARLKALWGDWGKSGEFVDV